MLLLCALIVGSGSVWAETYTIGWGTASGAAGTYTNFTATSGTVTNVVSFSTAKNDGTTAPAYNSSNKDLRLYYHSGGNGGSITLTPADGLKITGVVITTTTEPSVKYSVDGGTATSVSASSYTYTISGIEATASLIIQNVNTTNTQLRIKTIVITYESTSTAIETITAIDASSIVNNMFGENTDGGSLSATVKDNSDNIITTTVAWSGNNNEVATINASTGVVTLVGVGVVTFTASYAGVDNVYRSSSDTYELTVINEDPDLVTIWSEDFSSFSADDVPSDGTYNYACTDGGGTTKIYNNNNAGGTSPELLVAKTNGTFTAMIPLLMPSYGYSGDLTLKYKTNANSLNINTTTDGVTVDGEETPGAGLTYSTAGEHTITFKGVTTSTENITIVFTATSSNVRLDDIVLKGKQAELTFVATPTISPAGGAIASGTEVTITCATDGATIYYTTDGTTPTSSSSAYNPLSKPTITSACTIKAIAIKDGLTDSEIASVSYTIAAPCATPTFSVAAGEVTKGTTVTISSETDDATIYYTTNGSTPTTSSSVYSSAITINAAMTLKAIAVKDGYANSEVASAAYTVIDYATLPFNYNSGKSSITSTTGLTESGLGSDYGTTNTKLKFDNTDDYLILKINETPGILSFNATGNSFSGGTFTLQVSPDGTNYSNHYNVPMTGSETKTIKNLPENTRYIKWIYTNKVSGNVGLGNISLEKKTKVYGTISPAGWNTLSSQCALDLNEITGGTAYYASDANGSIVTLSPTTATVPAGEGLMIKGTAGAEFTISVVESGTAISGNLLKGQTTTGNVAASTAGTYHYIFGYQTSDPSVCGFYNLAADTEIAAGKAYLETGEPLTLINPNAPAIIRILDEENNATSFERIDGKNDAIKFFENGQIYILREGVVYDALGRKVR